MPKADKKTKKKNMMPRENYFQWNKHPNRLAIFMRYYNNAMNTKTGDGDVIEKCAEEVGTTADVIKNKIGSTNRAIKLKFENQKKIPLTVAELAFKEYRALKEKLVEDERPDTDPIELSEEERMSLLKSVNYSAVPSGEPISKKAIAQSLSMNKFPLEVSEMQQLASKFLKQHSERLDKEFSEVSSSAVYKTQKTVGEKITLANAAGSLVDQGDARRDKVLTLVIQVSEKGLDPASGELVEAHGTKELTARLRAKKIGKENLYDLLIKECELLHASIFAGAPKEKSQKNAETETNRVKLRHAYGTFIEEKFKREIVDKYKYAGALYTSLRGSNKCRAPKFEACNLPDGMVRTAVDAGGFMNADDMRLLLKIKTWYFAPVSDNFESITDNRSTQTPGHFDKWTHMQYQMDRCKYIVNTSQEYSGMSSLNQAARLRLDGPPCLLTDKRMGNLDAEQESTYCIAAARLEAPNQIKKDTFNKFVTHLFRIKKFNSVTIELLVKLFPFLKDINKVKDMAGYIYLSERLATDYAEQEGGRRMAVDIQDLHNEFLTTAFPWGANLASVNFMLDPFDVLGKLEDELCDRRHFARDLSRNDDSCEFCAESLKKDCMCPPYAVKNGKADYCLYFGRIALRTTNDVFTVLAHGIGLYHVLYLHYGHVNVESRCWLLEIVSRSFKLGCHEQAEEKWGKAVDFFKKSWA